MRIKDQKLCACRVAVLRNIFWERTRARLVSRGIQKFLDHSIGLDLHSDLVAGSLDGIRHKLSILGVMDLLIQADGLALDITNIAGGRMAAIRSYRSKQGPHTFAARTLDAWKTKRAKSRLTVLT